MKKVQKTENKYKFIKLLGKGSYGKAYLVEHNEDHVIIINKILATLCYKIDINKSNE